jgi:hypothetical protein
MDTMNNTIYFDAPMSDELRRRELYEGQLFAYSKRASVQALCRFARAMTEDAFAPLDPRTAQFNMDVQSYARLLGELKPRFINHPEAKKLVGAILVDLGCDPEDTYFDVPRMRTSTSSGYLTTGIAYAWHPHRDTWYSAPACQINWWLPFYEITSDNAMAFHPTYFSRAVANDSSGYDYGRWNRDHRGAHVSQLTKADPRPLSRPIEPIDPDPQTRLIVPVGAIILFSAAQMHSSVPNTSGVTRLSIDFRTVHRGDAQAGLGARNVDSHCTGTNMSDFLRVADLQHLPEDLISRYAVPAVAGVAAATSWSLEGRKASVDAPRVS